MPGRRSFLRSGDLGGHEKRKVFPFLAKLDDKPVLMCFLVPTLFTVFHPPISPDQPLTQVVTEQAACRSLPKHTMGL